MKSVINLAPKIWQVESEPGDATHYSYVVINNYDDWMFAPWDNTFRYPQKINKWEMDDTISIAEREQCSQYTIAECVRTIRELSE